MLLHVITLAPPPPTAVPAIVVDRHHVYVDPDPDPTFYFDGDPDPSFHFEADPIRLFI